MKLKILISPILLIILGGLIFRLVLAPQIALSLDHNTFIAWGDMLAKDGFKNFYSGWSDYLPGYLYILWFLGKVSDLNIIPNIILFKLPAIISDLLIGYLIYLIVLKLKNKKKALIAGALWVFNFAPIFNSSVWGQVDSLVALFTLLTLFFVEKNIILSSIFLSITILIKPQGILLIPLILFLSFVKKWKVKKLFLFGSVSLAVIVLFFIPFNNRDNIFQFIIERFLLTANQYPFASINAFSFWGLWGFWKEDTVVSQFAGLLATFLLPLIAFPKLSKVKGGIYIQTALIFLSSFLFTTRMHERHLLPALPFLVIGGAVYKQIWLIYITLSLTYILNLYYAFVWISENFKVIFSDFLIKIFIILNISGFLSLFKIIFSKTNKFININIFKNEKLALPKLEIKRNKAKKILFLIIAFTLVTRFFLLDSPKSEYFDEVYHAFTAKEMQKGNTYAWEWWNTPPQGFAYEWTHPPVSKHMMKLGMFVFGQNSFGYRAPAALFGTISVFLVYLLAKALFGDVALALLSSFVFAVDGLVLVMSRIGMNDIYFLTFILASIYFFVKEKNFFSAIFLGLALSSKWSTLWALPIFPVIFLLLRKRFKISHIFFLFIPIFIYISSYYPLFFNKKIQDEYVKNTYYEAYKKEKIGLVPLDMFIDTQKQIWWYHTRLNAEHPYTSKYYTWPLLIRPIWLYTSGEENGVVGNIYGFGNPAVFWLGFASIIYSIIYFLKTKSRYLLIIIFSYFIFFAGWAFSPRIMFFYHYLPSIPFLAISLAFLLRTQKRLIIPFVIISVLLFAYFYPHLTGIKVPLWLNKSYYWFSSWR